MHTLEPYDEQRPRIREIARAQDLRLVQSPDLAAATRRVEEALGIVTVFYEGGDPDIAGFSPNGNPDIVFLNSRPGIADLPLAWTFAHEAMHAAQKDARTRAAELWEEIRKLLTPLEAGNIESLLSRAYAASKHDIEAPAFLAGDAISGHDFFGLSHLENAEPIRKLIVDFYDGLGLLNPSGLEDSPDTELARTGSRSRGRLVIPSGRFEQVRESMSARPAAYQSRITGRPADINYIVAGVKFDGFDEERGVLLEAKGPGYATFVKNGRFRDWFKGAKGLVSQAERQLDATSRKLPIEWHFAEEIAAQAVIKLFKFRDVTHISVIYTP